jgi:hypothetical protein
MSSQVVVLADGVDCVLCAAVLVTCRLIPSCVHEI